MPDAAASKPSHSSGKVKSSGSSVVSQSIKVSATSTAANTHQAAAVNVQPQCQTHQANSRPVTNSTNG